MNATTFDTTNGGVRVIAGAMDTTIIIAAAAWMDMSVTVLDTELPWLINALEERHREILRERQTAADAARLLSWNTAAGEVLT